MRELGVTTHPGQHAPPQPHVCALAHTVSGIFVGGFSPESYLAPPQHHVNACMHHEFVFGLCSWFFPR